MHPLRNRFGNIHKLIEIAFIELQRQIFDKHKKTLRYCSRLCIKTFYSCSYFNLSSHNNH